MQSSLLRRPTMVLPPVGFTARVMARIEAQERAKARRHALIGEGLLVFASIGSLTVAGVLFASVLAALLSVPDAFVSSILSLTPLVDTLETVASAILVAGFAAMEASSLQILSYAIIVAAATLLWVRIVQGSLQLTPRTSFMGESK